jgi:acetyl-CoA carboxylase carboxyltransferase component
LAKAKDPEEVRKRKIEEYKKMFDQQPYHAASMQRVEEIIDPRDTRPLLIKALQVMSTKKVERPWKKHGNIPL